MFVIVSFLKHMLNTVISKYRVVTFVTTLDGMDSNESTGTNITPGTLVPCLENIYSLDNKGRNHESIVKEHTPLHSCF